MSNPADLWSFLESATGAPRDAREIGGEDPQPEAGMTGAKNEEAPWRQGWQLSEEKIEFFREKSNRSREAKQRAIEGKGRPPIHPINAPQFDPSDLMPRMSRNGLRALSLFSGGGGLDLGFDLAGYNHVASYDILPIAGETLRLNRPEWVVFAGPEQGDVTKPDWGAYRGKADVIHGGPPCQPFSTAGRQLGNSDTRDMFPTYVRAILACQPKAFIAENVTALSHQKFRPHLEKAVFRPLAKLYRTTTFELKAEWFGVPQTRTRFFIVGFRSARAFNKFRPPEATHGFYLPTATASGKANSLFDGLPQEDGASETRRLRTMGVREALGLPPIACDNLAPTLRSGFTGPRGATSVNSSVSALREWGKLQIWPNGVAANRLAAHLFVPENGHFRLSIQDCGIIQGFPETWAICGAVYAILGQIGNSVAPPMAYQVALAVAEALAQ